ncbi:unnamed protein product, partial [marine sediment metagenome]
IHRNKIMNLNDVKLEKRKKIDILVDRMTLERDERERLVDSLEIALKKGEGKIKVQTDRHREFIFSNTLECKRCEVVYEDPFPNFFSFNSPQGACPTCHGFGDLAVLDEDKIIPDKNKSLEEGAIEPWTKPVSLGKMDELISEAKKRGIAADIPFKDLKEEEKKFILDGGDGYHGIKGFFDWLQTKKYKVQVRVFLSRYRKYEPCPDCKKMRLNLQALSVKIEGLSIGQVVQMTVQQA